MEEKELLKATEVAEILSCSTRHVYILIKKGKLDVFRDGITRIYRTSLEEYISNHTASR